MGSDPGPLLRRAYRLLFARFGPQHWWPARTRFEVMVGAVLTQNTNWKNVERAVDNLRAARLLTPRALAEASPARVAERIRPSGYYNIKTRRLLALVHWIREEYGGDLRRLFAEETATLRHKLLSVPGIGPETADSILLYAGNRPVFVVDAYTRRILSRHGLCTEEAGYHEIQALFERHLPRRVPLYNEYHALLVRLGKEHCTPRPACTGCPLSGLTRRRGGGRG